MFSFSYDEGGRPCLVVVSPLNKLENGYETETCDQNNFPSFLTLAQFSSGNKIFLFEILVKNVSMR